MQWDGNEGSMDKYMIVHFLERLLEPRFMVVLLGAKKSLATLCAPMHADFKAVRTFTEVDDRLPAMSSRQIARAFFPLCDNPVRMLCRTWKMSFSEMLSYIPRHSALNHM